MKFQAWKIFHCPCCQSFPRRLMTPATITLSRKPRRWLRTIQAPPLSSRHFPFSPSPSQSFSTVAPTIGNKWIGIQARHAACTDFLHVVAGFDHIPSKISPIPHSSRSTHSFCTLKETNAMGFLIASGSAPAFAWMKPTSSSKASA